MRKCSVLAAAVVVCAAMGACGQTSAATNSPVPLATRVVAYDLDARVDTAKKSVDATEVLTYRNLTGQPLSTFPFHLYLNGFQPDSTFTSETHFGGGIRDSESEDDYPAKKLGFISIAQLAADGFGDLTGNMRFVSPDDGNPHDKTVALLTLPRAVAPGEAITFRIRFHDQFPESVARNGYKRDFIMGGQWYPKLGVFWHGAWNCHQYHATTEFFSDFGTFHVAVTLPRRYVLGASGVPVGVRENADGTVTRSFYGEDIHDFAWAASPHFYATDGTFQSSLGPVQVHVLALSEHPRAGKRYLDILMGSLSQFGKRYGPYPYKILTLIDPEPDSEIGGMEYPTLITGDTGWFEPTHVTEITAEHEFGHQYWYGMVATNEFEDAWLDEGINSYTELKVTSALLGRETNAISLPWANLSDASLHRLEYLSEPDFDPVTRHAWQFRNSGSYGGVTYGKSGALLTTLEGLVGTDVMDEAMRTYFMRFRFQHPTTEDFLATIVQVAAAHGKASPGQTTPVIFCAGLCVESSLEPYFRQAVYGTAMLDYAIDSIASNKAQWWLADSRSKDMLDTVTVHRIGDFKLPVNLEVVFANGERVRERWDPALGENDRWHTFTYARQSEIVSAEIDPDHIVPLDANRFNDSITVKGNGVPARKLTNLWMSTMQLVSQVAGWLV